MMLDTVQALHPLLLRDLMVILAAREECDENMLDALARRRGPVYAHPETVTFDETYWPAIATALAPVAPPEWMPMSQLIANGTTLEGGARGLRGLFTREPSEKERRKVQKVATLTARVLEIVASANKAQKPEEQRLIAMAMASFGLTPDELDKTRATGPVTFENLEIFGELDPKTRRDLLRGAWQLCLVDTLDPSRDVVVRGIAARLEVSGEYDPTRAEVVTQQVRQTEMATAAVELCRAPTKDLPEETIRPWLQHLVDTAAPPSRRSELSALAFSNNPVLPESLPRLDAVRRRQAISLALATLLGHDPPVSIAIYLRASVKAAAVAAEMAADCAEAFDTVDRFLFERLREQALTPAPAPPPPPPALPPPPAASPPPGAAPPATS